MIKCFVTREKQIYHPRTHSMLYHPELNCAGQGIMRRKSCQYTNERGQMIDITFEPITEDKMGRRLI